MLDAYLPPDSDTREKRPVVVYMHGGAFVGGDKQIPGIIETAKRLTQRGYAVVSINYRLTGEYWRAAENYVPLKYAYDAMEDMRAAIRFVRSKAEEYNLDTDMVIAAGDSAGGITSLNTAYAQTF